MNKKIIALSSVFVLTLVFAGYFAYMMAPLFSSNSVKEQSPPQQSTPQQFAPQPFSTPLPVNKTLQAIQGIISEINYTIKDAISSLQENILSNPNLTSLMQAKIIQLQDPNLAKTIIDNKYFAADFINSINGKEITIAAIFPTANMSKEASNIIQNIKAEMPILENFMTIPFPYDYVTVWYGFNIGNYAAGPELHIEQKESYYAREPNSSIPFEALYFHELSHNYVGHESLNHFLEIYQYNVFFTNSTSIKDWTYTPIINRTFIPLLEIYKLIGHDSMSKAYKAIYQLHPLFSEVLSQECKQVFIDQAPPELRSQVALITEEIQY